LVRLEGNLRALALLGRKRFAPGLERRVRPTRHDGHSEHRGGTVVIGVDEVQFHRGPRAANDMLSRDVVVDLGEPADHPAAYPQTAGAFSFQLDGATIVERCHAEALVLRLE
jgi:hypothetical protein